MRRDMRAARIGRKGSRVHHDISHAAWVVHPHCEGFGRVIPLLNVERLCPKVAPESGIDPLRSKQIDTFLYPPRAFENRRKRPTPDILVIALSVLFLEGKREWHE